MIHYTKRMLDRAIAELGSQAKLAKKVGVSKQAVSRWTRVPEDHVRKVERLTGISKHELRPDIYGPAP